jgi:hypothetical protein
MTVSFDEVEPAAFASPRECWNAAISQAEIGCFRCVVQRSTNARSLVMVAV